MVHWIYKKVVKGIIGIELIPTALQHADPVTKPALAPLFLRSYDYTTGVRFYPPADSKYDQLMDFYIYNATHTFTIRISSFIDSPTTHPTNVADESLSTYICHPNGFPTIF